MPQSLEHDEPVDGRSKSETPTEPLTLEAAQKLLDTAFPGLSVVIRQKRGDVFQRRRSQRPILELFFPITTMSDVDTAATLYDAAQVLRHAGAIVPPEPRTVIEGKRNSRKITGFAVDVTLTRPTDDD